MRWAIWMLLGCADLPSLEPGVCGNGVLDPGEDCDLLDRDLSCAGCKIICSAGAECPEGWVCGADLICRHPSARFKPIDTVFAPELTRVVIADIDGDAVDDVVGHTADSLVWWRGGPRGLEANEPTPLRDTQQIAAGDLDGDGGSEVLAAVGRSFASRLVIFDEVAGELLRSPRQGFAAPLPDFQTPDFGSPTERASLATGPAGTLALLQEVGDVRMADIYTGCTIPLDPVPQILLPPPRPLTARARPEAGPVVMVVPNAGANEIAIFQVGTPATCSLGRTSTRPQNGLIGSQAVGLADANGDGAIDIVMDRERTGISIALGDGAGAFAEPYDVDADGLVAEYGFAQRRIGCFPTEVFLPLFLAAGDLDGDGRGDDFVSPGGVLVEDAAIYHSFDAWWDAEIADFNADGNPDVAAAGIDVDCDPLPGIDLILLDGEGNSVRHQLSGPVLAHDLAVGDFDGDLIADLAVAEGVPGISSSSVWVFYGDAGRGLTDVRRLEFEGFVESITAYEREHGFWDLAVLTADGPRWITILQGASGRVLDAPIEFNFNSGPTGIAVGPIDLARGDDVFVALPYEFAFFSGLPAQRPVPDLRFLPLDQFFNPVLAAAPGSGRGARGVIVGANADQIANFELDAFGDLKEDRRAYAPLAVPTRIELGDIEADGVYDALLDSGDRFGCSPPMIVLDAAARPIPDPIAIELAEDFCVRRVRSIQVDLDPELELVIAGAQVQLAEWSGGRAQLKQPLSDYRYTAEVGDFDGDGIDDILLADPDGLTILRACPHDDPCD